MSLKQVTISGIIATILFYLIAWATLAKADQPSQPYEQGKSVQIPSIKPYKPPVQTMVEASYTDEQIINAIYLAEGGSHAQYPYGIRSIKCSTQEECRHICKTTIRNNRIRFKKQEVYKTFLTFLASRYCPTKGNLSKAEQQLNKNWIKNVTYFLNKTK